MKRRLWLIPLTILAVFLDCFVFPAISKSGVRPLCVMSLALAATAETKVQDGILLSVFCGFLTDLFCNPYLGLSAAAYLIAVCIEYGFVKNRGAKRLRVLFGALAASTAAETVILLFSLIIGARFNALGLLTVTLPSIVLETLLVLPLCLWLHTEEKGGPAFR